MSVLKSGRGMQRRNASEEDFTRALGASQKIPFKVHRVDLQLKVPRATLVELRGLIFLLHNSIRHRAITIFCLVLQGVETAAQVLLECCDEETTLLTGGGPAEQSQHFSEVGSVGRRCG